MKTWDRFIDGVQTNVKGRRDRGKELSIMSLPILDNEIWGIQKQKLTIVAARPSNGKSSFVRQLALDFIMQNKNVMVFSWEETKQGFIENLVSLYGKINTFDMVKGHIDTPKHDEAFNGIKNILVKNNLWILEKRGRTLADFENMAKQANNIDCIIVDYIQLIKTEGRNEREAYNEFIKNARTLAKELNCAVIIASQINRSTVRDKQVTRPMLHEIKGCVHGDSMVGDKSIKDRVESGDYSPIPTPEGYVAPSRLINSGRKACIKIKTSSGKELIVSKCTPVKTQRGWVKGGELKKGDSVYEKRWMS